MKINPEKFYTPKEIVKLGIMSAKTEDTQKQMLLRFIRQKRIVSVNLGGEKMPRYVIQGKHLLGYMDTNMRPGDYEKK